MSSPSISRRVKKYFSDQYSQYGNAIPKVITDKSSNSKDVKKYSKKSPVYSIFLVIF